VNIERTNRPYLEPRFSAKSRYHMGMRRSAALALLLLAAPAAADTFGGFSGVAPPYLVNQDRACMPLEVKAGNATGTPDCQHVKADDLAGMSIKPPVAQHGATADFAASASGRTLTVTNASGAAVVTWNSADPIGKIIDVYASPTADRVAVAYTARAFGHEATQVVAFLLVKTDGRSSPTTPTAPTNPATVATAPAPQDPKIAKAVADARKLSGAKAIAAWQHVLALDAQHSEAQYRIAAAHAAQKQRTDAIALLQTLAKSSRSDAIEWLVEARFDPAFADVRADHAYRDAVGLDRPAAGAYERLMGLGGQWLQNGTQCDTGEVHFTAKQNRTFSLVFRSACHGGVTEQTFKGTWELDGTGVKLVLPTKGKVTADDVAVCTFEKSGDEDALRCAIGKDLDFVVLPVRR
jgi:hypothetical protein